MAEEAAEGVVDGEFPAQSPVLETGDPRTASLSILNVMSVPATPLR